MKALAVFLVVLGCMALFSLDQATSVDSSRAKAVAANFAVYRNAVHLYAITHKQASGTVSRGDMILPPGWQPIRSWQNRIVGGRMYVWGDVSASEAEAIMDVVHGSLAVGVARNGHLENRHCGLVEPLPGFVREHNIVSVIVQPS